MGKKFEEESEHSENEIEDEEDRESEGSDEGEPKARMNESKPSQQEIESKFGLKSINNEQQMLKRLKEVETNFYNRMESAKLIKRQGRVPFTEHMSISKLFVNYL
jgi:hypothetical protein